ncbi:MAG: ribulokinase [Deltaproteobacteria bacterium]|nr:ribulokinase [Deltaproteobacteria bacterium]
MAVSGKRNRRYALGLDYGTESVRALVVDCTDGTEAAEAVVPYSHGVISRVLPGGSKELPPDFALQHPGDYLDGALKAVAKVLEKVDARDIVGIGVDFTACTILPITKDGTPLMQLEKFRSNPHSWVKLWKHHAAQPEADAVNRVAAERSEKFLKYYSGLVSSEWMLPKCWELATHAPEVYAAADYVIDAGDWIVHQLTGQFTRNSCAAGYKGLWNSELGFPSQEFLTALDPKLSSLRDKWLTNIVAPGAVAGRVTKAFAAKSGLIEGTPVSAATIDAHSGVAGMGVYREGPLCLIMGTSTCHMALSRELHLFDGYAGVVKDGIIPGFHGYESGQSAVGDIFGWFSKHFMDTPFDELSAKAAALKAGQSGLVALDWHNGNRSVLMNANLTGMILGMTLETRPEEVYRALIEATAFGTRAIVDTHVKNGVPVTELVVCGGLVKDPLIMQIYADVTGVPVKVAASGQAVALGAAIFGALAATGSTDVETTITRMTKPPVRTYLPVPEARATFDRLYQVYARAHDLFGRENAQLMKNLKALRKETLHG